MRQPLVVTTILHQNFGSTYAGFRIPSPRRLKLAVYVLDPTAVTLKPRAIDLSIMAIRSTRAWAQEWVWICSRIIAGGAVDLFRRVIRGKHTGNKYPPSVFPDLLDRQRTRRENGRQRFVAT